MDVGDGVEEKRRREEEIRVIKMQAKANREVKGRGQARALQRKERKPARKHDGCRWRTGEEVKRRGEIRARKMQSKGKSGSEGKRQGEGMARKGKENGKKTRWMSMEEKRRREGEICARKMQHKGK